jgi:hypothetical protein
MTSEPPREAFVWVWLPEATEPVVAGRLRRQFLNPYALEGL